MSTEPLKFQSLLLRQVFIYPVSVQRQSTGRPTGVSIPLTTSGLHLQEADCTCLVRYEAGGVSIPLTTSGLHLLFFTQIPHRRQDGKFQSLLLRQVFIYFVNLGDLDTLYFSLFQSLLLRQVFIYPQKGQVKFDIRLLFQSLLLRQVFIYTK